MKLQEKKYKKIINPTGDLLRKNLLIKGVVNPRFKAISTICQRKTFYRQRIPEPSCIRKEPIDIGIPLASRDGDRKIM